MSNSPAPYPDCFETKLAEAKDDKEFFDICDAQIAVNNKETNELLLRHFNGLIKSHRDLCDYKEKIIKSKQEIIDAQNEQRERFMKDFMRQKEFCDSLIEKLEQAHKENDEHKARSLRIDELLKHQGDVIEKNYKAYHEQLAENIKLKEIIETMSNPADSGL